MDISLLERLDQLETRFKRFSMTGTDEVLVAGNLKTGFTVNVNKPGGGAGGGGGGTSTGACCYNDGTCDVLLESDCVDAGGYYQGDGTVCDPNPCVGACCEPGCVDNTTPDGCALDGGTFQGFGTKCDDDPPPCALPPCNGCGYDAFDGSGRKFLTKTYHGTIDESPACCDNSHVPPLECSAQQGGGGDRVYTIDPTDCSETLNIINDNIHITHCDGSTADVAFGENSGLTYIVMSATYKEKHSHIDGDCGSCGAESWALDHFDSYTLSDECTP